MLVGESPSNKEGKTKQAFSGKNFSVLNNFLEAYGLDGYCYKTFLVKCRPDIGDVITSKVVENCGNQFLSKELLEVKPKIIIGFGYVVNRYFLGKVKAAPLSIVQFPNGTLYIPFYSPVYISKEKNYTLYIKVCDFLKKAVYSAFGNNFVMLEEPVKQIKKKYKL